MSQNSDLSAYERLRLENIRRNNEFLAQIGLFPQAPAQNPKATSADRLIQEKKKRTRQERESILEPRRRSSRLSGSFRPEDIVSLDDEHTGKKEQTRNEDIPLYDRIAQESDELDDFEFQAFVELRKWRLLRSRELELEPYKIFQNRTFCDMVRRRRNDPTWAVNAAEMTEGEQDKGNDPHTVSGERSSPASSQTASTAFDTPSIFSATSAIISGTIDEGHDNEAHENTNTPEQQEDDLYIVRYDPTLIGALTDCFGIATGKTRKGGFAWEALAALNRKKVAQLLEQSRLLQPGLTKV